MSLKDFKHTLQSCSSRLPLSSLQPAPHPLKKPPKRSSLKQQIASIERLAAHLDCTPSGESLPASSPPQLLTRAGDRKSGLCSRILSENLGGDRDESFPPFDDDDQDENSPDPDWPQPIGKRSRFLVDSRSSADGLETLLRKYGVEVQPTGGAMRASSSSFKKPTPEGTRSEPVSTSFSEKADFELLAGNSGDGQARDVQNQRFSRFKAVLQRGHKRTKKFPGNSDVSTSSMAAGRSNSRDKSAVGKYEDLDTDSEEEGIAPGVGDSEAGLFIKSEIEGLFEPLILWPPSEEGCNQELETENMVQVPASINSRLLEHQRVGVKFLYNLYRENRGGVLGDDMGLGKTIQTIAFLAAILKKNDLNHYSVPSVGRFESGRIQASVQKPVLIICPTSVLRNWEQEFQAWGSFKVAVYHGAQRELVMNRLETKDIEIILTSFDTFRIHGTCLCTLDWECVILDEAHRLKNERSQLYRVCAEIETKRRYGLTGTIMQNKFMDLFNVFDWATPGCLGTREHFREFYDEPLKQGQRISAPERFVCIAEERRLHLTKVLQRHLLRRTKEETIGHLMMGKEDNVVFCNMSPLQRRVYRRLLESPEFQCLTKNDQPCGCGSPLTRAECCHRTVPDGVIWSYLHRDNMDGCDSCPYCLILPCLTKLQQVCNHLELIKPNPKDDSEKQKKDEALATAVFGEDANLVGGIAQDESFMGLSDSQHCGKMQALETLLAHWLNRGDKVLLFSYSVRMLDILDKFLIRKGYCFSRLDGSTPMSNRQSMVDDFNSSPSKQVFLISTRAGGLGLNLVSANRVVIFDPNWNPAQDLQAQDRSFRYGQRRHVTVFRLLTAGSLEELVYSRQIYKQQLFNIAVSGNLEKRYFEGVQDSKGNKGELFGIKNLFQDLSEKAFTSEIIESHEERLLSFHQGVAAQNNTNEKYQPLTVENISKDVIDDQVQGGDAQSRQDPLASDEQGFRSKNVTLQATCSIKTSCQDELLHILPSAGIIYAHRHEDVVNYGASKHRTTENPSKNISEEDVSNYGASEHNITENPSKKNSEEVSENNQTSQDDLYKSKVKKHVGVKHNGTKLRMHATVREHKTGERNKCLNVSSLMTDGKGNSEMKVKSEKAQQFSQLAKFKCMEEPEFSKWLLSSSESDRQKLLDDYKQSGNVRGQENS